MDSLDEKESEKGRDRLWRVAGTAHVSAALLENLVLGWKRRLNTQKYPTLSIPVIPSTPSNISQYNHTIPSHPSTPVLPSAALPSLISPSFDSNSLYMNATTSQAYQTGGISGNLSRHLSSTFHDSLHSLPDSLNSLLRLRQPKHKLMSESQQWAHWKSHGGLTYNRFREKTLNYSVIAVVMLWKLYTGYASRDYRETVTSLLQSPVVQISSKGRTNNVVVASQIVFEPAWPLKQTIRSERWQKQVHATRMLYYLPDLLSASQQLRVDASE